MATPIPDNRARLSLQEVVQATTGSVVRRKQGGEPVEAVGVTSDSRRVVAGSLFVALRGEQHDGHAFAAAALAQGARMVIVERGRSSGLSSEHAAIIEVDDTLVAWGALAHRHLERWREASRDRRVIGITGSAGK